MPARGQIYNVKVSAPIGPWENGVHPGLVISQDILTDPNVVIVVPLTSSKPRRRSNAEVELTEKIGDLQTPIWIKCQYVMAVPVSTLGQLRGHLPLQGRHMAKVSHALRWMLRLVGREQSDDAE